MGVAVDGAVDDASLLSCWMPIADNFILFSCRNALKAQAYFLFIALCIGGCPLLAISGHSAT